MRVLVLGADGFVGRRVVNALAASGWATPVAGRRREGLLSNAVESITLDARDEQAIAAALQGIDAVVNCVTGDAETIVQNARALFAAAAKTGVHVVYLSSMAVYGSATGVVDEDTPLLGSGGYAGAKVQAEQMATGHVTIFRPGCIYGSDSPQWTLRIARLLSAQRLGDLGAAGDGCSNLVHIADVVEAILAALRRHQSGVETFNLAMPNAPDWNEYFVRFATAIRAVPVARIPDWRLKLETKVFAPPFKILEMIASRVSRGTETPAFIPPSLAGLWSQDIRLNSARATQRLGIVWTDLDAGLAEAASAIRTR